jgi:hypothetical protein
MVSKIYAAIIILAVMFCCSVGFSNEDFEKPI